MYVWVCGCFFFFTKQYSSLLRPHHLPYFIHSYSLWILLALTLSVTPLVQVTIVIVQSLSLARLFVTPWTAGCQASLAFTVSQSLLKCMSIELAMPSNHLILCHPLLLLPLIFPNIRVFSNELAFHIRWPKYQSFGASASVSVLPMNIQGWFPLGLTGLISLPSKGLSRVFSSSAVSLFPIFNE